MTSLIFTLAFLLRLGYADPEKTHTEIDVYLDGNNFEGDIKVRCSQIKEQYDTKYIEALVSDGKLDPDDCSENNRRGLGISSDAGILWNKRNEDGVVEIPYHFDTSFDSPFKQKLVATALKDLAKESGVVTFVESNQKPYINVIKDGTSCWSSVGRLSENSQNLSLGYDDGTSCVRYGVIHHEFLHALGFWHEHSRPDRDRYIQVVKENISDGNLNAFNKRAVNSLGSDYDYGSVMHYPAKAFSKNKLETIIVPTGKEIGQREKASHSDIIQLRLLYQCTTGPRTLAQYNKNPCTKHCKCWAGQTGCGNNGDLCQGDLICYRDECMNNSPPTPSPTSKPRYTCAKMDEPFRSGYGDCRSYAKGTLNQSFCEIDKDRSTGILAVNACSECDMCIHEDVPTSEPTQSTRFACAKMDEPFQSSFGVCKSYAKGAKNHNFCDSDQDQSTGILAVNACSECDECAHDEPTPPPTDIPPIEAYTLIIGSSSQPSSSPKLTSLPSGIPSSAPIPSATTAPSGFPTSSPSLPPSKVPTFLPTEAYTLIIGSSSQPSSSSKLTSLPTAIPSSAPIPSATTTPSGFPTSSPSLPPSKVPIFLPTSRPSNVPTQPPTTAPISETSLSPSELPTPSPSAVPIQSTTTAPSELPTSFPSLPPPTSSPSTAPTPPTTTAPTSSPSSPPKTSSNVLASNQRCVECASFIEDHDTTGDCTSNCKKSFRGKENKKNKIRCRKACKLVYKKTKSLDTGCERAGWCSDLSSSVNFDGVKAEQLMSMSMSKGGKKMAKSRRRRRRTREKEENR